jgi:hypothetical protein
LKVKSTQTDPNEIHLDDFLGGGKVQGIVNLGRTCCGLVGKNGRRRICCHSTSYGRKEGAVT